MKVVRLSVLRAGSLYPPRNIPGTHFCSTLSQPQGHSAAGRIMSMKNSNDTIGNRTRDFLACSAIPQPTAPSCSPSKYVQYQTNLSLMGLYLNCQTKKLSGFPSEQITIPHTTGKPNFCCSLLCLVQGIDWRNVHVHTRHMHNSKILK